MAINSYEFWSAADLATKLTQVQADIARQVAAGSSFGDGVGRTRTGVDFELLTSMENAIKWAQGKKSGTVVSETVADLSRDSP